MRLAHCWITLQKPSDRKIISYAISHISQAKEQVYVCVKATSPNFQSLHSTHEFFKRELCWNCTNDFMHVYFFSGVINLAHLTECFKTILQMALCHSKGVMQVFLCLIVHFFTLLRYN